jgi:hypothetical protein
VRAASSGPRSARRADRPREPEAALPTDARQLDLRCLAGLRGYIGEQENDDAPRATSQIRARDGSPKPEAQSQRCCSTSIRVGRALSAATRRRRLWGQAAGNEGQHPRRCRGLAWTEPISGKRNRLSSHHRNSSADPKMKIFGRAFTFVTKALPRASLRRQSSALTNCAWIGRLSRFSAVSRPAKQPA